MIDSHCHLADEAFVPDLADVITRAQEAGLTGALCIVDLTNGPEVDRARRVGELWPAVGFAAGIHPHQAGQFVDKVGEVEDVVRGALSHTPGVRAVGEIGLDYHYDFAPPELQQEVFRRQIRLARDESRPVVIHTREADDDTVRILREEGGGTVRGVFHCFTGDTTLAQQTLDLGSMCRSPASSRFPAPRRSGRPRNSCRPTGCSPKPTRRILRRHHIEASATSRRGSPVSSRLWQTSGSNRSFRWPPIPRRRSCRCLVRANTHSAPAMLLKACFVDTCEASMV